MHTYPLNELPASSSERLCNGTVSGRPSVCLSRRLISAATCSWVAAARAPAADIDRYLPPASQRSSERAASMLWSEEDRHRLVRQSNMTLNDTSKNLRLSAIRFTVSSAHNRRSLMTAVIFPLHRNAEKIDRQTQEEWGLRSAISPLFKIFPGTYFTKNINKFTNNYTSSHIYSEHCSKIGIILS